MSQSNYIAAALAVAFLVYITAKGSLQSYVTLLTGGAGFGTDTAAAGTKTTEQVADDVSSVGDAVKSATDAAQNASSDKPAENGAGPLDILGSVMKGTIGGPADDILGGMAGKMGLGAIVGGFL